MPEYRTAETIIAALERFNKRAYNAGLRFKVEQISKDDIDVLASFDFAYYVNVRLQFKGLVYTDLKENNSWPDAWNEDQLFLLQNNEVESLLDWIGIEYGSKDKLFGLLFNIAGWYGEKGIVICTSLVVQ